MVDTKFELVAEPGVDDFTAEDAEDFFDVVDDDEDEDSKGCHKELSIFVHDGDVSVVSRKYRLLFWVRAKNTVGVDARESTGSGNGS